MTVIDEPESLEWRVTKSGRPWLNMTGWRACLLSLGIAAACASIPEPSELAAPWMDARLSPDVRAELLVREMTLSEKLQLLHGEGIFGHKDYDSLAAGNPIDVPGSLGGDGFVRGIPRLGIPDLQMNGGGLGITNVVGSRPGSYSTALPSSLALASSWDPSLASMAGTLLGRQASRQGFNVLLGGGVNLATEARNGRNFEYLSEDPVLTGKMIAPQLRAIQEQHVIATIKHFALNNLETNRVASNSIVDERTMRETEILAFEIGIQESGVGAVMCSYNLINGSYACENSHLLMDILKGEWGFKGWVLSDWGATHSTVQSVMAGLDQEQFSPQYFGDALRSAVQEGVVPMARIDDMVKRQLRTMFAVGVFGHRPVLEPVDIEAGNDVAQRIAEDGSVLLKNAGGLLPLSLRTPSIAIIGRHADVAVMGGSGSAQVADAERTPVQDADGSLANIWHASSPLNAIRAQVPATTMEYASGEDVSEAVEIARRANIAVVLATQHRGEEIDVPLKLPAAQDELIRQVSAANANTIVVLESGGAVLMPWIDQVPAVLEVWYPGSRGGPAIANLLFGRVNPSGKLPISFPRVEEDLPPRTVDRRASLSDDNARLQRCSILTIVGCKRTEVVYSEGLRVGYKWYDSEGTKPLFPFGYGLSYTQFEYSELEVARNHSSQGVRTGIRVIFKVRNVGVHEGAETAEIYLSMPTSAHEPPRRLIGWNKVLLRPGESRSITVTVDPKLLAIWSTVRQSWEVPGGEYTVFVGRSSRDLPLWQFVTLPSFSLSAHRTH